MCKLKEYRNEAKVSQNELALELGVSPRYIAFLETGDRTPSLEVASKIANYFKVTIEDIFLPNECTNSTQG